MVDALRMLKGVTDEIASFVITKPVGNAWTPEETTSLAAWMARTYAVLNIRVDAPNKTQAISATSFFRKAVMYAAQSLVMLVRDRLRTVAAANLQLNSEPYLRWIKVNPVLPSHPTLPLIHTSNRFFETLLHTRHLLHMISLYTLYWLPIIWLHE